MKKSCEVLGLDYISDLYRKPLHPEKLLTILDGKVDPIKAKPLVEAYKKSF